MIQNNNIQYYYTYTKGEDGLTVHGTVNPQIQNKIYWHKSKIIRATSMIATYVLTFTRHMLTINET